MENPFSTFSHDSSYSHVSHEVEYSWLKADELHGDKNKVHLWLIYVYLVISLSTCLLSTRLHERISNTIVWV